MEKRHLFLFFFTVSAHAATVPTVYVNAAKFNESSYSSGPDRQISQEYLNLSGTSSLADALRNFGGVQLQDMVGNGSQVALGMRGFGMNASSNTLLLINGIPVTNPDMAAPDLNAIPIHEIESIEVIAGSESVLYGDQAVGGVINIHTKQKSAEKIAASCSAGSYNFYGCYAFLGKQIGVTNFFITTANKHTDNYRDHNDDDQNSMMGNILYPYPNGQFRFNYKIANDDMQYPGALTAAQVRQDREQSTNDTDYFKNWNAFLHAHHQQQFTSDWQLATDLAYRVMHGHGVLFSPFTQSRATYFLKPQANGYISHTNIVSGVELQGDQYQLNSAYGNTDNRQQEFGLFALTSVPAYTHFSISLGARGAEQMSDLHSTNTNNIINRALATTLGGDYKPDANTDIYLRRAGSFRFPKADENSAAANGVGSLRTQRGISYETGAQLKYGESSGKISIYQLNLRDEIAFDPLQTPQQPFGSNQNLAPTMRRGFTISGNHPLTNKLMLDGQYNYVRARFQNGIYAGNFIPLVAESIFHAGLNARLSEHWNVYTEALFTGSQYSANDNANVGGKVSGYTLYHFSIRYLWKNITASLRVNNVFNKYYYFYTVYQPSLASEYFYPAPTRNFVLAMEYGF